jgi:hypothetical protein
MAVGASATREERQLQRRGVLVWCLAAVLVTVDVGGTLLALEAAADFKAWRLWESFTHRHAGHAEHSTHRNPHPPSGQGHNATHYYKPPTDNAHEQEAFDASVVELCALLILRLAGGAATAMFYWPRSFLRRPRSADGLFSVRFFCEAAFALCAVACALKTGLVVYSTWFARHRHHGDGSGSSWDGSWDEGGGGEEEHEWLLQESDDPAGMPPNGRQQPDRLEHLQGIWLCVASVLATICSVCYVLLCRYVGNRNWRDPSRPPDPSWLAEQQRVFGARFLLFIALVNLLYGVTTSWFLYFNTYYLARDLKLNPSQLSSVGGTINLCIIVRPLLGFLSDSVPICGSTRSAYFFIAATGSACCYLALAYLEPLTQLSVGPAVTLLCFANILGYAWCGVLLYAIVATEQRREPVNGAAQLNAIQWGFYSGGSLLGDLSEGVVLEAVGRPHHGYWLCFVCWVVMAFCGLLYEEGRPYAPAAPWEGSSLEDSNAPPPGWEDDGDENSPVRQRRRQQQQTVADVDSDRRRRGGGGGGGGAGGVGSLQQAAALPSSSSQRRTDDLKQGLLQSATDEAAAAAAAVAAAAALAAAAAAAEGRTGDDSGDAASLAVLTESERQRQAVGAAGGEIDAGPSQDRDRVGLKQQMHKLWVTLNPAGPTQGVVLSAVLYIFLTWAVVPDVGSGATYYFYTGAKSHGGLEFGDVTYSMLSVVGDIAMLGASYIYGAYLGSTPLRKLFIGLQLLNVAASALDLALALHWNERLGISAAAFAGMGKCASCAPALCLASATDPLTD